MTGLGFSAERKHVEKLPVVPEEFVSTDDVIVVEDSKEGWAQSYREFIAALYRGEIPKWDLRRLRPEGARLKTFGGRSSGPEPLNDLFEFTGQTFVNAAGRKMTSMEAHDIMCKIGSIVVVGGVRRSALISLSSLDDAEVLHAKDGAFWETHPHRALSNNSAVYHEKPSRDLFDAEWNTLAASGSGERGIFNLAGAKEHSPERRDSSKLQGTNPCLSADTWVMTDAGPRQIGDIVGQEVSLGLHGNLYDSTGFFKTGTKQLYKVTLDNGMSVRATDNHQVMTSDGWKDVASLTILDSLALSFNEGSEWSGTGTEDEGYLLGLLVGDGTFGQHACIDVWESSSSIMNYALSAAQRAGIKGKFNPATQVGNEKKWRMCSKDLSALALKFGIVRNNKAVTKQVEMASSDFYSGFLRGYFDADGSVQGSAEKGMSIRLDSINVDNLYAVQRMLSRLGAVSKVYVERQSAGEHCQASNTLVISRDSMRVFRDRVGFGDESKSKKVTSLGGGVRGFYQDKKFSQVVSITEDGIEDVFDATVPEVSSFDANGIHVHNCAEILLRSQSFCNLSEVIVRPEDTLEDLKAKVALATKIGTWQSTLTNFPYLRDEWRKNAEEERLLGVSLTGQMDHPVLNFSGGKNRAVQWLKSLKQVAIRTNEREASRLGINPAAAITTVKPSGTVSQLTDSASGIHPRHDNYYIRTVRGANMDPLTRFMSDAGVPNEPDVTNPNKTTVFSFPTKSPESALTRSDMTAIEQLESWLVYKVYWAEHSVSITVSVKDDEWDEVGDWVYDHFDQITGVSFLPHFDHVYKQAPYQTISREEYLEAAAEMPDHIRWEFLSAYELEDTTSGSQTPACMSGQCELVDIGA